MGYHLIACEILRYEVEQARREAGDGRVTVEFLRKGYHDSLTTLRQVVQERIEAASSQGPDAVLLGYGLCGTGLAGIRAVGAPLVIPRTHDCIAILMGSARAYDEHFREHPGTYYYSPGWVEWGADAIDRISAFGPQVGERFVAYVEKYGEDNARYLIEQENAWAARYTRAVFIDTGVDDPARWEAAAREIAASKGLSEFTRVSGDLGLLRQLMAGEWEESEFLVVSPGSSIAASHDNQVMRGEP